MKKLFRKNTKLVIQIELFILLICFCTLLHISPKALYCGEKVNALTVVKVNNKKVGYFKNKKEALKHVLPEDIEEVIAKMKLSSSNAWEFMFNFLTSKVSIEFNGEEKTLSEIRNLAYSSDANVRKEAFYKELELYDSIKDSIAFSLNNIKQEVNTTSKMRGFETALDESLENAR
mgnify:CR=1 FL=1